VRWTDGGALDAVAGRLRDAPGWEGVFTHFHSADTDPASTAQQWDRFQQVLQSLPHRPALVHAANSAGALCGRAYAADLIRPGIFLYGGEAGTTHPTPVATLRARILGVRRIEAGDPVSYGATWRAERPTTIATMGVGYADGLPRAVLEPGTARPRRQVELNGALVPIVGRVTMDMTMLDVGGLGVAPGDVATIYGGRVSLDQQAAASGTVSYEMLTSLGLRVPRRYRSHS
jgi:alanine racemase